MPVWHEGYFGCEVVSIARGVAVLLDNAGGTRRAILCLLIEYNSFSVIQVCVF